MNQKDLDKLSIIQQILPHRPPFLFVDNIIEFKAGTSIVTERVVSSQEVFFQGHFPGNPVMPGVLISEALAQTSGLLIGLTLKEKESAAQDSLAGFVLTTIDMKFLLPVTPGSTLRMSSILTKKFGNLYRFNVAGTVSDRTIAKGSLSLGRAT
jgi:3-hydroxymyristoyl/3-hydroxydecanoyl-(acyl carrier protein) dehydratase